MRNVNCGLWLGGASFFSIFAPLVANAQEAPSVSPVAGGQATGMEIVVTATKRSERLQDVPFAISAITADNLTAQGELRLVDISARVPGLQISDQSVTSKQTLIVIRGLSGAGNGNPTAAIYLDDAPLNASTFFGNGAGVPDLDPSDLERIEVLKGPQGTLYGATSVGGLVKYITRAPDYTTFSARVEASATSVNEGELGYALRGRFNAPISDSAAITASAFRRTDPGFINDPVRGRKDVNSGDQYGGRVALGLAPADNVTINIAALHQRQKTDAAGTVFLGRFTGEPIGRDLEQNVIPGAGESDSRSTVFTANVKVDFDSFNLVSASSYISRSFVFASDLSDFFGAAIPAGTGVLYRSQTHNKKFTQEMRLNSTTTEGLLGWQFGVFYTEEKNELNQNADLVLAASGMSVPNAPILTKIDAPSEYKEFAASGTVTMRLSDQFDIEGGARYSHNKQTSAQTVQRGASILKQPGESSESKTTFSINARYRPSRDLMVYTRVASGFRPGGPNAGQVGALTSYNSDSVISYEVGAKGSVMDRLLTFDLAAYYVDWSDIQLQGVNPLQFLTNAGTARSKGVEAAFVLTPADGLTIDANIAYTDAYLVDSFLSPGTFARAQDPLPFAPKWAHHIGVEYALDLTSDWQAKLGAGYRYVGKRASFFESSSVTPRLFLDPFTTVDFNVGVENDRFAVNLFLRNAFDERKIVSGGQALTTIRLGAVNQPRTLGVSVIGKF